MKQFDFEVRREQGGGSEHFAKGDVRTLSAPDALALVQRGALVPKGKEAEAAMKKLLADAPVPQPVVQPVPTAETKHAGSAPNNKADVGKPVTGGEGLSDADQSGADGPEQGGQTPAAEGDAGSAPAKTAPPAKAKAPAAPARKRR